MFRTPLRRLGVAALAGALIALPTPAAAAPAAPDASGQSVTAAVTDKLLDRAAGLAAFAGADASDTRVTVTRDSGKSWTFGTAVLLAPHVEDAYPQGWLFLAQRDGHDWRVAFEGEADFARLAGASPVVTPQERTLFAAGGGVTTQANGDYRTGMRLPYAVGQTWYYTGGPHGTNWNSIDLAGGDLRVLAARRGTAYTMCKGWVRIIHDRGYATDYYHLWNNINVNGAALGEGAFLGDAGTDVTCGGSATGRHVHFMLRQNDVAVGIAGHNFGKWVIYNGGAAYQGYALHGSTRVNVGGTLYNYGALGLTQGVVDTNGGGVVNKRSGPGTGYAVVGTVADGATVSIACSSNGTSHTGRYGTTALWNKLTDGSWVSDAFVWTGVGGPVNGWC